MDLQFIPLSLILISLAVIIKIIYKKVPEIKKKELEYISKVTQKKIKFYLLEKRLKTKFKEHKIIQWSKKYINKIEQIFNSIFKKYNLLFSKLKLKKIEVSQDNLGIDKVLSEVENLILEKKFKEAEDKLINILKIDAQNIKAYEKLVELYTNSRELKHAEATLEYLIRLARALNRVKTEYFTNLAEIKLKMEKLGEAMHYIEKAYEIEPRNPKILDLYLKICLNTKDNKKAKKIIKKLQEINPEDEKLKEIEKNL